MSKVREESYYKILGTTANIGQARIEEKYLQAIEKHPRETDPEGYQKVQAAYKVLKDPAKRAEYDKLRKNGKKTNTTKTGKVQKTDSHGTLNKIDADILTNQHHKEEKLQQLIIQANTAMTEKNTQKAFELFQEADKLAQNNGEIKFKLLKLASKNGDINEMERIFNELVPLTVNDQELQVIYTVKADIYQEEGYLEKAVQTYEELLEKFPDQTSMFAPPLANLYANTEQSDKAMQLMEQAIPADDEDIKTKTTFYLFWLHIVITSEKWSALSGVQAKFKKHIKSLDDEEHISNLRDELLKQYEFFYYETLFQEAEIYIALVLFISNNQEPDIKKMHNEAKQFARLQKEINKLHADDQSYPLLYYKAFEWFYAGKIQQSEMIAAQNELPIYKRRSLEADKESYAAGILRLRKKYPLLYKPFRSAWDNLFNQLTSGFNRQQKRDLRKKK